MLTQLAFTRPLTLLKCVPVAKNEYGNDVRSWPEVVVEGCTWWPSSTTEAGTDGGDIVTSRLGVLFPDGTDVSAADRVRLPDTDGLWRVDGDPRQHFSPITGATGRIYAWLERVTG